MKFIRVRSLQSKILLLFAFLLIVVQFISSLTTYRANQKLEKVQLNNRLTHANDVFSTQFNNRLYYLSAFSETVAKDYGLKSSLQEDSKSFLVALNNHRSRINGDIAIAIDKAGVTFAELVTYKSPGQNNKKIKIGAGQGKPFPYPDEYLIDNTNKLIKLNGQFYQLSFAPIKSGQRTIAWLGFGYVIDDNLADDFSRLTEVDIGFVLSTPNETQIIAQSTGPKSSAFSPEFADSLISKQQDKYIATHLLLGEISSGEIIAVMHKSKADLLEGLTADWQQFFILIFLTLILSVIGALGIARGITKPIKQLIEQIKQNTKGNYQSTVVIDGTSELTQLADEFNHMTQAVISREETITYQAFHDALTSLPNKNALLNRLANKNSLQSQFMAVQLSILGVEKINDTLGHKVGDDILLEVTKELSKLSKEIEIYYLGSYSFMLVSDGDDVETFAKVIASEFKVNCQFGNISLHLQYAMGILQCNQDIALNASDILQRTSVAVRHAIKNKLTTQQYKPEFDKDAVNRLYLTNHLKTAIENDQLVLFYQPKMSLANMQITHVEALVRWQHPEKGLIPPDSFISIAEKTGQMGALTRWVTRTAFEQYLKWQLQGIQLQIAINISAQNLLDKSYSDYVIDLKSKKGIPNEVITLEVTEDAVVADPEQAKEILNYLSAHGFKISIDDYGTGYSSLAQLKQLPVQELKVDRSFVQHLASDESDKIIVKSSIEMAHNLGLSVVAEGIEDEYALLWLKAKGCELAQGFFISRPLPVEQFDHWFDSFSYPLVVKES